MPTPADILAKQALEAGRLIAKPAEGELWKPDGRRAEYVDRKQGYGRVRVRVRPTCFAMAHRIIWIAAHGDIPNGLQVNHRNRRRWDNRIENLDLVTPSGNIRHAHGYGYDGIGTNVDLDWVNRLDHGDKLEEPETTEQLMNMAMPGRTAVFRWDAFV